MGSETYVLVATNVRTERREGLGFTSRFRLLGSTSALLRFIYSSLSSVDRVWI